MPSFSLASASTQQAPVPEARLKLGMLDRPAAQAPALPAGTPQVAQKASLSPAVLICADRSEAEARPHVTQAPALTLGRTLRRGSRAMASTTRPAPMLMPATTWNAKRQPSRPSGRRPPTDVAKKPPARPPGAPSARSFQGRATPQSQGNLQ